MDSASTKPFVSLFDSVPAPRHPAGATLSASIWAPQPLPSDTAWSRAIDSISRVNDELKIDTSFRPEMRRACSHPAGKNNDDVFGPVGLAPQRRKDVGAIGDGRRKMNDEFEAHVSFGSHIHAYMGSDAPQARRTVAAYFESQFASSIRTGHGRERARFLFSLSEHLARLYHVRLAHSSRRFAR